MSKINLQSVNDYIKTVEPTKKEAFEKLRATLLKNLPKGFEECIPSRFYYQKARLGLRFITS